MEHFVHFLILLVSDGTHSLIVILLLSDGTLKLVILLVTDVTLSDTISE